MRIVSVILLAVLTLGGAIPPGGSLPPTVTLDLRSRGWRKVWDGIHGDGSEAFMGLKLRVQLDGRGHVYAGFMVRRLVPLNEKGGAPWTFRVLTVNARTGAVERTFDFPTDNVRRNAVLLSSSGRLLVLADDRLRILAADGKTLAEYTPPPGVYYLYQSSSLSIFLVWLGDNAPWVVLDSDTLAVRARCSGDLSGAIPESISDRRMYFTKGVGIEVKGQNEILPEWRPFCSSGKLQVLNFPDALSESYYPATDARFVGVENPLWELWEAPSHRAYTHRLRKHEVYDVYTVRIAANGSKAAFLVIGEKGGSVFFDITPRDVSRRVEVYDLRHPGRIATIPLPFPMNPRNHYDGDYPDFNFSPDGRQLAVLYQGVLRVYRLPAAPGVFH